MENNYKLFIQKYQPIYFDDFGVDNDITQILKTLILIDNLNIMLIGGMETGKTSLLNALIREYYNKVNPKDYEENVLYINKKRFMKGGSL